jgi:RimJ/RimL family protein N-acetyltransferase
MDGRFGRLEPLDSGRHARALYAQIAVDATGKDWTYLPYGPFESFENYRRWIDETCRGTDPLFFAIVARPDMTPVGVASYLRIAPAVGSIEVGHIHYSAALKQTPLATEAMFLMMQRAFSSGYRRYEWKCDALNAASRAAAERLGFTYEGTFRQATVYKGRNRDTAWFSVIDSEWPELQHAFLRWLSDENFDRDGRQRARLGDLRRTSAPRETSV